MAFMTTKNQFHNGEIFNMFKQDSTCCHICGFWANNAPLPEVVGTVTKLKVLTNSARYVMIMS